MSDLPEFLEIRSDILYTGNDFNDPKEIGFFSMIPLNKRMKVLQNDDSMKKYFIRPISRKVNIDLNEGYDDNFKMNPFTDEKIDNVLDWIMDIKNFQPVLSDDCVDFVTSRGTISKLLCTPFPFDKYNRWRIYASKFRSTIYLIAVDTEEKKAEEKTPTEENRKRTYWGKKFEQCLTAKDPNVEPDLTSKCYDSGMFCIIATNKIGNHKLLFRAEMDALQSDPECSGDTSQYIELKTCDIKGLKRSQPYKHLKIWAQCIPVGVEDIVCGHRSKLGHLTSINYHKTSKLPELQKGRYHQWSPESCFSFCNYFLHFLKEHLKDDYKSVIRFDYTGGNKICILPEKDEKNRIISDNFVEKFLARELVFQSESHTDSRRKRRKIH